MKFYLLLSSLLESIPRVSATHSKRLNRLGIKTIKDLLYHFPFRYDDLSLVKKISDLQINEVATIRGEIINIKILRTFKKKMWLIEALIKDDSGTTRAVWYNQPFLIRTYKKGTWISLAGKVNYDGKTLFFSNPAHEKIPSPFASSSPFQERDNLGVHTGRLIPIYPETAGITSKWLRYILKTILPKVLLEINDFLPEEIKKSQNLIELKSALEKIHAPKNQNDIDLARRRLGFDELFLIQLYVLEQKKKWQKNSSPQIKFNQELIKKFVDSLPFKLTDSQRKTSWEILQDLEKPIPMNRLLEGDVGSGKTVVATIAALQAVKAGFQVALMAPTEILAQQHFAEISKLLNDFNMSVGLITSADAKIYSEQSDARTRSGTNQDKSWRIDQNSKSIKKPDLIKKIAKGELQIIIGTHSLISAQGETSPQKGGQKRIKFNNLGLVILDEQHRFGVNQRQALLRGHAQTKTLTNTDKFPNESVLSPQESASSPHFLSMTATPIPRTLALTIYGDLDLSIIKEMPKGRQKIITKIVSPANREKAYEFIRQQVKNGKQTFVICPRIDPPQTNAEKTLTNADNFPREFASSPHRSAWLDVKTVKEEYEKLSKKIFPDFKIAMLHGKMPASSKTRRGLASGGKSKEEIMRNFKDGKIDILVSTSVIEVGIDIPNATIMMIEGAERFGLAQIYQFRGRVGRGEHQSYCFLFPELSSQTISQRLKAIVSAKNGFELAEKDLEMRGPGEFWGGRQWGLPDLVMASLSDAELINQCRAEAEKLLNQDPELKNRSALKEKLSVFKSIVHLE